MYKTLTPKEYKRLVNELDTIKYLCSYGHRVIIPRHVDKQLCSWCHKWVFKNKKDEFKFRLKEKLNENN